MALATVVPILANGVRAFLMSDDWASERYEAGGRDRSSDLWLGIFPGL